MTTWITLLRSVNVLGKNMIKMPDLVRAFGNAGFTDVRTYIQSGNIIFDAADGSGDHLTVKIRELITKHFGLTLQVLVLNKQELSEIVSNNPFTRRTDIDHTKLHVTFIDRDPEPEKAEKLLSYNYLPDEIIMGSGAVYLYCPEGYGRTKYNNTFIEKKLGANATTRNWNTCLRLLEMCSVLP
jgi:uncharacterized protein (DUF1697 family)